MPASFLRFELPGFAAALPAVLGLPFEPGVEVSVDFFAASAVLSGVSVGCVGGGRRRSATGFREPHPLASKMEIIKTVVRMSRLLRRIATVYGRASRDVLARNNCTCGEECSESRVSPESFTSRSGSRLGIFRRIRIPRGIARFQLGSGFRHFFRNFTQEFRGTLFGLRRDIFFNKPSQPCQFFVDAPTKIFKFIHGFARREFWRDFCIIGMRCACRKEEYWPFLTSGNGAWTNSKAPCAD